MSETLYPRGKHGDMVRLRRMEKLNGSIWQKYLREDFSQRQKRNPGFSLRSYSKQLNISPAQLSQMISGKRDVTAKVAVQLSEVLGVSGAEALTWLSPSANSQTVSFSKKELLPEEFTPISEWYYYAILGMASLDQNLTDPNWIAERLNIPIQLVDQALRELVKSGHLKVEDGSFRRSTGSLRTKIDVPSASIKKFHRQILQIASQKLETVPVEKREFNHMTIAINPKKVRAAKRMLREFAEKFTTELGTGKKTAVYHLNLSFYPIAEEK